MNNLNYANQNLQNRSFKGQDLAGADFSGSDLRGCNFTQTNLTAATFQGCKMGQSRRQVYILIFTAIGGSVILVGFGTIVAHVLMSLFGDTSSTILNWVLVAFVLFFNIFFRDSIVGHFPQVTMFLGLAAITLLFAIMSLLTLGLAMVVLSNFSDGTMGQGLFLLLVMVISAFVTFWIFKWLIQSIQSHPGTSFKKANLSHADLSYAEVQNTDFSLAILTGVCIFNWTIKSYTQFTNIECEYLYLEPARQNRQPAEGRFQSDELGRLLAQGIVE